MQTGRTQPCAWRDEVDSCRMLRPSPMTSTEKFAGEEIIVFYDVYLGVRKLHYIPFSLSSLGY